MASVHQFLLGLVNRGMFEDRKVKRRISVLVFMDAGVKQMCRSIKSHNLLNSKDASTRHDY